MSLYGLIKHGQTDIRRVTHLITLGTQRLGAAVLMVPTLPARVALLLTFDANRAGGGLMTQVTTIVTVFIVCVIRLVGADSGCVGNVETHITSERAANEVEGHLFF